MKNYRKGRINLFYYIAPWVSKQPARLHIGPMCDKLTAPFKTFFRDFFQSSVLTIFYQKQTSIEEFVGTLPGILIFSSRIALKMFYAYPSPILLHKLPCFIFH